MEELILKNKIVEILAEKGKTQKWLSDRTKLLFPKHQIDQPSINKIANCKLKNPTMLSCYIISISLGKTVDEVFYLSRT